MIGAGNMGGAMLAERVAGGLPRRYLGHRFAPGEWRDFMAALDAAATDEAWIAEAVAAADATFAAFAQSAAAEDHA